MATARDFHPDSSSAKHVADSDIIETDDRVRESSLYDALTSPDASEVPFAAPRVEVHAQIPHLE